MTFWTYMLHCNGGYFYTGHTDDLEHRMAQHAAGEVAGFVRDHWPAKLVWSADFATRYEALSAERQIKGWSRAKKLALIRGDWEGISALARGRNDSPSTGSGGTGFGGAGASVSLVRHPSQSETAVDQLTVAMERQPGLFILRYEILGRIDRLKVPAPTAGDRANGLWEATCFEAFVSAGAGYVEFNFSPSRQWAAYRFDTYRDGMRDEIMPAPKIATAVTPSRMELTVAASLPDDVAGRVGLSAVIEEAGGAKSYWALAHPPGPPDFHHPDCFAVELPAPDAA